MLLLLLLFASCASTELTEPKFQVLTPNELMVEVPHYEDARPVTFRIGVQRAGHQGEDLELGENEINNNRVFIYDQRLNLREGDVVNYLLALRDQKGYRAQTGNYNFNGVYFKNSSNRRMRFRRHLTFTTEKQKAAFEETEEFNPVDSGFGFHNRRQHPHHWPYPEGGHRPHGFNPWFGGPQGPPQQPFPSYPGPGFQPPNFGCNDPGHGHDGRDIERYGLSSTSTPPMDVKYCCEICESAKPSTTEKTTSTTPEDNPDIDVRFGD